MFERRLTIFLCVLLVATLTLVGRAVQLQIIDHDYWTNQATETMKRESLIETTRGRILDVKGRVLAEDRPCIDAAVDYRALMDEPDPIWLKNLATARIQNHSSEAYKSSGRADRKKMLDEETTKVKADIDVMFAKLAKVSGQSSAEIDDVRRAIVRRVGLRRQAALFSKYTKAMKAHEDRAPSSWWKRWLIDDTQKAPQLEEFSVTVSEQVEKHVILRNISPAVYNELWRHLDDFPGLELRPSKTRVYPFGTAACHVLGNLTRVSADDLDVDPNAEDDLRRYYPNDLIGRGGLEGLCEPMLRGTRGRLERFFGDGAREKVASEAAAGRDVRTTIDIDLQKEIAEAFNHVPVTAPPADPNPAKYEMHGGAVVIDLATNEVRALVSAPSFDVNQLSEKFGALLDDQINRPLMNRATQDAMEPGSTAKPLVGLGAITQGLIKATEGIECTGYLILSGRKLPNGRCWVASRFANNRDVPSVSHHPIPTAAPHVGRYGNPDGFLCYSDALERSCNVYFETLADRLGLEGMRFWFKQFGLGQPTGIGVSEVVGHIPTATDVPASELRSSVYFSGIGQGQVAATPIQMCNVIATIARGGIWLKPRLVSRSEAPTDELLRPARVATTQPIPDRRDLHLSAEGLAAAKDGMMRVVATRAGTGAQVRRSDVVVAGKTGTAQTPNITMIQRDENGTPIRDERGKVSRITLEPNTAAHSNPSMSWYRGTGLSGTDLAHSWYVGFAPAENPKVVFAVMVEYGGSGGIAAGSVANQLLDACIRHGYIPTNGAPVAAAE